MPTSGVVVDRFSRDFGSWTTAIVVVFTAMPWHFKPPWIARKPEQGRFEHFDDQKGAKRTRSWNWKWLQNQIKLSRPFLQGFARFRLRSKCTCCLGNSRCSTVDEKSSIYVTITHSYVLAFFATRFLLLFRSHFCRDCSFTRRYQHDSVLEPFSHFGRRTSNAEAVQRVFFLPTKQKPRGCCPWWWY